MKLVRVMAVLAGVMMLSATAGRADDRPGGGIEETQKPAATTAKMPVKGDMTAVFEAKEHQMNEMFKNKDAAGMMMMIDPNGWQANPSGISSVMELPGMVKASDVKSYTIESFRLLMIDKDAYVTSYVWKGDATMNGQPFPPGPWYCSTVWAKRGKDWKAVYHQETLSMPAPASTDSK